MKLNIDYTIKLLLLEVQVNSIDKKKQREENIFVSLLATLKRLIDIFTSIHICFMYCHLLFDVEII